MPGSYAEQQGWGEAFVRIVFSRVGILYVLAIAIALAGARQALAHARLVRSRPADKAELARAPGQIELWFNELLDEGFNTVQVFPAQELMLDKHSSLSRDAPRVEAGDRTHLVVQLQALPPGDYVVEWRVLSRDGHRAPGRFRFRVRASK